MVTGDHPITAQAIATQVNIIDKNVKVADLTKDSHKYDDVINAYKSVT